jgi:hypothetical protein
LVWDRQTDKHYEFFNANFRHITLSFRKGNKTTASVVRKKEQNSCCFDENQFIIIQITLMSVCKKKKTQVIVAMHDHEECLFEAKQETSSFSWED